MSNSNAIGTLIVATLLLATTAIGSSPVYAKDHKVHSFLPRGTYAQSTSQEARQGVGYARRADDSRLTYRAPTDVNGNIINPTDYQRGGTN